MNLAGSVSLDQIAKLPNQLKELDKKFDNVSETIQKVTSTSNEILRKIDRYHSQYEILSALPENERVVIQINEDMINKKIANCSMSALGLSFSLVVAIIAICTSIFLMLIPSVILGVTALVGISVSSYYLSKNL
jgi:uncharacterized membrane protein